MPTFASMLTREYRKRCGIRGFRRKRLSAKRIPAAQNSQPRGSTLISFRLYLSLDFGGVAASASYTNLGLAGSFGLLFSDAGDQLFLSTMGAGGPFSDLDVGDVAERLRRVLVAMTADPTRRVSSIDVLDER